MVAIVHMAGIGAACTVPAGPNRWAGAVAGAGADIRASPSDNLAAPSDIRCRDFAEAHLKNRTPDSAAVAEACWADGSHARPDRTGPAMRGLRAVVGWLCSGAGGG